MSYHSLRFVHGEGFFQARDGLQLFEQYWRPDTPRAVVVIVHGYAEHSSRYASVAADLAENAYCVFAFDLRGHGRSQGPRCFVRRFDEYLNDLEDALVRVRCMWPGAQVFLLAHSMGGLISTLFVIREKPRLAGMILSAPSLVLGDDFPPYKVRLALLLSRFFPRLPTFCIQSSSLSRDEQVVRQYREDGLVYHGRTPVRTAAEIIRATHEVQGRMEEIDLPLLIVHGGDDRLSNIAGSRKLYANSRSTDKLFKVYAGAYHEVMNEPEKDAVFAEMSAWLNGRAGD